MANRKTKIDPYAFAMDVVSGTMTQAEIAKKWKISDTHVHEIVRRKSRPEIGQIIEELAEAQTAHTKARLLMLQDVAVGTVYGAMRGDADGTQLRAAQDVLNRTQGDPSKTEVNVEQSSQFLSRDKYRKIAEAGSKSDET